MKFEGFELKGVAHQRPAGRQGEPELERTRRMNENHDCGPDLPPGAPAGDRPERLRAARAELTAGSPQAWIDAPGSGLRSSGA